MNSSKNFRRIEKFFSRVGLVWQVTGVLLFLLIAGHYLLGAAETVHNFVQTGKTSKVDARYQSPVYDADPDKIAYWEEFNKVWGVHFEPYVHWKRNPFSGRFINVDQNGVRRTKKGHVAENSQKVFMFGGSTMWGTGASDDKTIPSYVQSMLGDEYDVYNFGDTGYVSAQELNALLLLLAQGRVPDIVIFYDGVNDGYAGAYSPAIPRDPHNLRLNDPAARSWLFRLFKKSNYMTLYEWLAGKHKYELWDAEIEPAIAENSSGVVDMYEAHIKQVKALATEYGFSAYFFWQPNLFSLTRNHLTAYEKRAIEKESPTLVESQKSVYQQAAERFSNRQDENIYFLGNIFDDREEPIYIDWHHVGPHGNEIVAGEMVRSMIEGKPASAVQPGP